MLRAGTEIALTPEKPVAGGWMLGRHDGQVVLMSGAIPGERVTVHVDRATRDVAYAHVIEVAAPHADRRSASRRWPCGGNDYAHIDYSRQLELKSEVVRDALRRIGRMTPEPALTVLPSPEHGYRMRARLHAGRDRLGFYREGTHEICDPVESGQLLDETIGVIDRLSEQIRSQQWDGVLSVELTENCQASERAIHIEAREMNDSRLRRLIVPGVSGLSANRLGAAEIVTAHGEPYVTDEIEVTTARAGSSTARLRRSPRSFFQGNRYLVSTLASRVVEWAGDGAVADLYAGVGLFATALAAAGRGPVTAVEGDPVSAADLRANAQPFGDGLTTAHLAVEDFLRRRAPAPETTLVVDPPRTGLSREARAALAATRARRLVYVSCDAATLARDVRALLEAGYGARAPRGA